MDIVSPVNIIDAVFAGILLLAALAVYVVTLIWLYRDAKARDRSPWLLTLLVAFSAWPMGLLIWYVARPSVSTAVQSARRRNGMTVCRECDFHLTKEDTRCPNCGVKVRPA